MLDLVQEGKEDESCFFSYLSQSGQKEALFHINAGEEKKLPFLYMITKDNTICTLEHASDGSKINFIKSGRYLISYKIRMKGMTNEITPVKITVKTSPNLHSHFLFNEHLVHLDDDYQCIFGHAFCTFEENDPMYLSIKTNADIDISCDSTIYTTMEVMRVGKYFNCKVLDNTYNGFTHQ